jgi:hypothetical protein
MMRGNVKVMQNDDLRITVVLGRETVASIEAQADAEYRSRSAQMRHMLERLVAWDRRLVAEQPTDSPPTPPDLGSILLATAHEHIKGASVSTQSGIRMCASHECEARFVNGVWTS